MEGNGLRLVSESQTDFWRITHYDFTKHDGHVFYHEFQGSYNCQARFSGKYKDLYNQAGLMLRLDDTNWIKAGIEYVTCTANASAVVAWDFSDWFIRDLKEVPPDFWVRAKRVRDYVEISFSKDSENFGLLRFAYFAPFSSLQEGIMAASPKKDRLETNFAPLEIEEG
jgi:regulation of enolase protein 1 (concanavalin A-like superfamily)